MSIENRIDQYSKMMRLVAFSRQIIELIPFTAKDANKVKAIYERFLHALANKNIIDDEINDMLPLCEATGIMEGFIDSTGFLKPTQFHECVMAMEMSMQPRLLARLAATDVLTVTADYPYTIDALSPIESIDGNKVKIKYMLNMENTRARALARLVYDTLKEMT